MRRAAQGRNLNMRHELLQRERKMWVHVLGTRARAFDLIWDYFDLRNNDTQKTKINKLKQIIEERLKFRKVIELKIYDLFDYQNLPLYRVESESQ